MMSSALVEDPKKRSKTDPETAMESIVSMKGLAVARCREVKNEKCMICDMILYLTVVGNCRSVAMGPFVEL